MRASLIRRRGQPVVTNPAPVRSTTKTTPTLTPCSGEWPPSQLITRWEPVRASSMADPASTSKHVSIDAASITNRGCMHQQS